MGLEVFRRCWTYWLIASTVRHTHSYTFCLDGLDFGLLIRISRNMGSVRLDPHARPEVCVVCHPCLAFGNYPFQLSTSRTWMTGCTAVTSGAETQPCFPTTHRLMRTYSGGDEGVFRKVIRRMHVIVTNNHWQNDFGPSRVLMARSSYT